MKKRIIKFLATAFCVLMLFGSITAGALTPYTSYTYDVNGEMVKSPDAYVPDRVINSASIIKKLNDGENENASALYTADDFQLSGVMDFATDSDGRIFISNTGKNTIVALTETGAPDFVIKGFVNDEGVNDTLSGPRGVFVTDTEIFVADTGNSRIVIFDKRGNFKLIVPEPASDVFPEKAAYTPVAVSSDKSGRIYVVSSTTNYGVIALNRDGSFISFIGPQKVAYNAWDLIWRSFQSDAQKEQADKLVPAEYNNLTIDSEGFIYVTTSADSVMEKMQSEITARSKSSAYAPVKKLNPNGSDVMIRNGFYPPSGEVKVNEIVTAETEISGPSEIVDVALGPSGMWSIIDKKRSRVFTYDSNGNLLFAFGDKGEQMGQISQNALIAIDYQGTNILLLDSTKNTITVFKRTEYGDLLAMALQNTLDQNFDKSVDYYKRILQHNSNYDSAYIGIAQSLYRSGDYEESMKYCKLAHDTENYSLAYAALRKQWIEKYVYLIPIIIVVACWLIGRFLKYAGKVNKAGAKFKAKRSLKEELLYAFHILTHPFDGFWDLKHEKRGSIKGATVILAVTVLAFVYQAMGQGYLYNPYYNGVNFIITISSVVLPVALWVVANWCLTTLFEGEGSLKDVYVTTCYSLLPLPLLIIPSVLFSNITILEEMSMISMLSTFAFIWAGMLLFFGTMVIHDYTIGKNAITVLASIVGMAFIMFICILFTSLIQKIFSFGYNIYVELSLR